MIAFDPNAKNGLHELLWGLCMHVSKFKTELNPEMDRDTIFWNHFDQLWIASSVDVLQLGASNFTKNGLF